MLSVLQKWVGKTKDATVVVDRGMANPENLATRGTWAAFGGYRLNQQMISVGFTAKSAFDALDKQWFRRTLIRGSFLTVNRSRCGYITGKLTLRTIRTVKFRTVDAKTPYT
jgi:hypothetical protein